MKTKEEILAILQIARDAGCPWVEVDGMKLPVPEVVQPRQVVEDTPEIAAGPGAEYTDEEMLYWATPYFDELQAIKEVKRQHLEQERNLRSEL